MTRDDIIKLALEAGFLKHADALYTNHRFGDCVSELERFAALVAAAEREACAELCLQWNASHPEALAAAIRARGEK